MFYLWWASTNGSIAALKTGAATPHLTGVKLRELAVIWPAISEQRRSVAYLDSAHAQVAALRAAQAVTAAELTRLEESILARAFRGEL